MGKGENASLVGVVENPKKVQIKEIDSLILARSLADVDAGAVITALASQAGLLVAHDAIAAEPPGGRYANVIAVQEKIRDQPWVPKAGAGLPNGRGAPTAGDQVQGHAAAGLLSQGHS